MLRSQQDQLPALGPYRERLRARPVEISQLGLNIYEWESLRREALHIDQAVESAMAQIDPASADSMREDIAAELRRVLEVRADILAELISNANDCLTRLEQLDAAATVVVTTTEQLESFIAEHVLWVRQRRRLCHWKSFATLARSGVTSKVAKPRRKNWLRCWLRTCTSTLFRGDSRCSWRWY